MSGYLAAWPELHMMPRRRVPVQLQAERGECALACLAMVAGYHGHRVGMAELRGVLGTSSRGLTLADLLPAAQRLRLAPRALRVEVERLAELRCPAILHWDFDHFVVLERAGGGALHLVDPACGRRRVANAEAARHFTGVALELLPASGFTRRRRTHALPLAAFFRGTPGLAGAFARLLALSLALQVFVLLGPLFGQLVIDDISVSADRDLLTALGIAFAMLVLLQASVSWLRAWLIIALGAALQLGWGARLFHHLLRLPLAYYEKRHMGDLVSRFGSLKAVEQAVSQTVIEGLIDGLMSLTTLALMLMYAPGLTLLAVAAVALYLLLRSALFTAERRRAHAALMLEAREQSAFMESLRAILPLKVFAREPLREAMWQNLKSDAVGAQVSVSRLQALQAAANTAIFGLLQVAAVWLGALAVLDARLTLGMLVAWLAWQQQFAGRAAALVDRALELRLIGVHLERIADIALAERDPALPAAGTAAPAVRGALEVRELWYRHSATEPPVLRGVSLSVAAGECVALVAPSGFGKTTLIKLMMGLLQPDAGEVLVDGEDVHRGSLHAYRRCVAAVMQDDVLLGGTLSENIALFSPSPDAARVRECARQAAVDDDIRRMPMGYHTRVGDMGATLSGGQRQRVLLARALYASPRVLFLDEATSHLDPAAERRVHEALASLRITRVLVAHRRETLAVADRVIRLDDTVGDRDA